VRLFFENLKSWKGGIVLIGKDVGFDKKLLMASLDSERDGYVLGMG
jgi:hypothetical protein